MFRRIALLGLLLIALFTSASAQMVPLTGRIISTTNKEAIPDATLFVVGTNPPIGITTDAHGKFSITAPVGRHNLRVSCIGYETKEIEIVLTVGRSEYLELSLEPASYTLDGVEIIRIHDKSRPIQPLLYAGARSFSVEEADRYAGTLGDPARMVRSFAGVMPINDSRNEIVVRGNSPLGVQYRMDGIEIPNPNHFNAGIGMTAGQVTALNMNLVTNSDFIMGGWQALQGNALAAIFDLNLRKGNPRQHQMRFQMGYNGLELMSEGPIDKKKQLTYIASYRYSIPELMSYAMKLFNKEMPTVPKYQDLTTKLHWQLNDEHQLSLIALMGTSGIDIQLSNLNSGSTVEVEETSFDQLIKLRSQLAMVGLTYQGQLSPQTDLKATLSWNYNKVDMKVDTVMLPKTSDWKMIYLDRSREHKLSVTADIHHRFRSQRDQIYAGLVLDYYLLNAYNLSSEYPFPLNDLRSGFGLIRAYAQYQHLFSERVSSTIGLHNMYLPLNGSYSVEPRAGLEYRIGSQHTLGLSGGLYAQLPPHTFFFVKDSTGELDPLSHSLGFSKSWHINLSYNYQWNKDWRLKSELYYQSHFEIPTEDRAYGTSLLNYGAGENNMERIPGLKNIGKGRNYGVELTLEKYFSHNYFLLISGTLYRSLYTDPILQQEFSTAFDGKYILNITGGIEHPFNKKWTLFAAPQVALAGGLRYTPVDEAKSIAQHKIIYQRDQWMAHQLPAYLRIDTRFGVRLYGPKATQEWGIDLVNITNRKNVAAKMYDVDRQRYVTQYHFTFFPMITYRVNFGVPSK